MKKEIPTIQKLLFSIGFLLLSLVYYCCHDNDILRGRRDLNRMVVGFTDTYSISAIFHKRCLFESRSWQGVLYTTLCDKVCQSLAASQWFYPVTSNNKTDRHDIAEILLKLHPPFSCFK